MTLAALLICAALTAAVTNAVFGREERHTQSIAGKERLVCLAIPIAIFVVGLWIKMSQ